MKKLWNIIKNKKLIVLLDQMVFSGCSFAVTLLLAHLLGPADFGRYTSIILFVYLMLSMTNALIIQPVQVSLPRIEKEIVYLSFVLAAQSLLILLIVGMTFAILQFNLEFLAGLNQFVSAILLFISGFLFHDFFRKLFLARALIWKSLFIDILSGCLQVGGLVMIHFTDTVSLSTALWVLGASYVSICYL